MSTTDTFNQEFAIETWTLYGVGMFLTLLRLGAQTRKHGIRKLRPDDWIIITVIPWYTLLVVSINQVVFGGGSNFLTPDELVALTPESKQARIVGSKWVLVSEAVMVLTVWTCKVCMLLIYKRLTEGLAQERIIKAVFIYVGLGFVACMIAFFTTCRPFSGYWSVPAIDDQCWSYFNFEVVEGTFNITADLIVLITALPLLAKLRIPIQQKLMLLAVFGMGAFVIAAAVLTKVYSLVPYLVSYAYLNWYFREASVSVYVTNMPCIWAFVRDVFPTLKHWGYPQRTFSDGTFSTKMTWPSQRTAGQSQDRDSTVIGDLEMFDRLGSTTSRDEEMDFVGGVEHITRFSHSQNMESQSTDHAQKRKTGQASIVEDGD